MSRLNKQLDPAITGSDAEKLEVDLVIESLVKTRLESGGVGHRQRQAAIRDLFTEVGCAVEEQRVEHFSGNVICTLLGKTSSTIVVGGHFDFVENGKGMVDDWSGASLLPSLYQALKSRPEAWQEELNERTVWDQTLLDGLDEK